MVSHPVVEAERTVRERWHARQVPTRVVTPEDPGAPPYVIHHGPCMSDDSDGAAAAGVAADVVARYRAMCGATVTTVAPAVGADAATPALGERLACLPVGERYHCTEPTFVDSVWWALAQLWEAGLLYETPHPIGWCSSCARVVDDVHADQADAEATSAVVRFPVVGDHALGHAGASLLVDVAEPWTVPATSAIAADPAADHVLAQSAGDDYPVVLARHAVPAVLGSAATVHRDVAVADLRSVRCAPPAAPVGPNRQVQPIPVIVARTTAGTGATGLRPVTPACAIEDWRIAQDHGLAVIDVLGTDGRLTDAAGAGAGTTVDAAGDAVLADLTARGLVIRVDHRTRRVGTCPRCSTPVAVGARPTWMVATTQLRDRLRSQRRTVDGLGSDREGHWATGDADWPVARPGTHDVALPLWRCDRCARITAVDGRAQLATLAGDGLDRAAHPAPVHADASFECPACAAGTAHRLPYTVDPTVVAAAMPFARFGFPAEPGSDTDVAHRSHADLLVDASAQTGRWADAVATLSVLLWNAAGADAALCREQTPVAAHDLDTADHSSLSELVDRYGADAVRLAMVTEPRRWRVMRDRAALTSVASQTVHDLRAAAAQYVAGVRDAGWAPPGVPPDTADRAVLHRWVLAELSDTVAQVRERLEGNDVAGAGRRVRRFVKHLTRWYLPRRPRATDGPGSTRWDHARAATAHECLVTAAALLAPFAPLVSDELYEPLVRAGEPAAPDSVHLLRFPSPDHDARDERLCGAMTAARRIVAVGQRARRDTGISADHRLPRALVRPPASLDPYWDELAPVLADALTVTRIERWPPDEEAAHERMSGGTWHVARDGGVSVALDLPDDAGQRRSHHLAQHVIGAVRELRDRQAVAHDRRVMVRIDADPEIAAAVEQHRQAIAAGVLAVCIELGPTAHGVPMPVDDVPIRMALREVTAG
ncbi:MAG: class I tRNA ligase family protein [Actinobacteria bacterium]|nr:class I tRNA ligase family protein [Actinomycetota bacterium]